MNVHSDNCNCVTVQVAPEFVPSIIKTVQQEFNGVLTVVSRFRSNNWLPFSSAVLTKCFFRFHYRCREHAVYAGWWRTQQGMPYVKPYFPFPCNLQQPMPAAYAGFGNPFLMPTMLQHPMRGTQQRRDTRPVHPIVGAHFPRGIGSTAVQPQILEVDESEKLKRWSKEEEEALLEWLELPGKYAQWKQAGQKASGGSTAPSGVLKAKLASTVIKTFLKDRGVMRTPASITNKIGYWEVQYWKAFDTAKRGSYRF